MTDFRFGNATTIVFDLQDDGAVLAAETDVDFSCAGMPRHIGQRFLKDAEQRRGALLIGAAAEKIAGQLEGNVPMTACGTLEAAVKHASERAEAGDTVLLAPACASFDQFQNYEERGRTFKTFVSNLVGKDSLR